MLIVRLCMWHVQVRSHAIVELHCHNIKTVGFAGECLFSAAEDEMAQWQMDL